MPRQARKYPALGVFVITRAGIRHPKTECQTCVVLRRRVKELEDLAERNVSHVRAAEKKNRELSQQVAFFQAGNTFDEEEDR